MPELDLKEDRKQQVEQLRESEEEQEEEGGRHNGQWKQEKASSEWLPGEDDGQCGQPGRGGGDEDWGIGAEQLQLVEETSLPASSLLDQIFTAKGQVGLSS